MINLKMKQFENLKIGRVPLTKGLKLTGSTRQPEACSLQPLTKRLNIFFTA